MNSRISYLQLSSIFKTFIFLLLSWLVFELKLNYFAPSHTYTVLLNSRKSLFSHIISFPCSTNSPNGQLKSKRSFIAETLLELLSPLYHLNSEPTETRKQTSFYDETRQTSSLPYYFKTDSLPKYYHFTSNDMLHTVTIHVSRWKNTEV